MPREMNFYQYFEQHADLMIQCCREFLTMAQQGGDITKRAQRIRQIEKDCDQVAHQCIDALHKTFITPFDRADIHLLIKRLDDVVDAIHATTSRMELYELREMRPEAVQLGNVLVSASTEILAALKHLRANETDQIMECCIKIHKLENDADDLLRDALGRLFKETDAILVIKWKEVYERLEKAADRCEAVANIIEGVVIESS